METWLVQQKREEKSTADKLLELIGRRKVSSPQVTAENSQKNGENSQRNGENSQRNGENSEKELELRVVPSAGVAEDNFAGPRPNHDEAEVALPQAEGEDNFDASSIQEAETCEARDLAPTRMRIENGGGVRDHPQRNK